MRRITGVLMWSSLLAVTLAAQPVPSAARLRAGAAVPLAPPLAVGGGEVVLDVAVDSDGRVSEITPARATPMFTDLLTTAVRDWRFDPSRTLVKSVLQPADGHVLVIGVFRPPQVYLGPTVGAEPTAGKPLSPELTPPLAIPMPASYPPRATRDGTVLIEIELTMAGVVRAQRVMSPPTPFDGAALDAVKTWRFDFPRSPSGAPQLFAYAVVSFREPVTQ
jgi:TonB family protein